MLDKCIYCLRRPVGSREHILQSGLGATRRSAKIVCGECNNSFSRGANSIDVDLTEGFKPLRSALWIFDGRGEPPPRIERFARTSDGTFVDMLPGSRFVPSGTKDETGLDRVELVFGSARRAEARVLNLQRQYGDRVKNIQITTSIEQGNEMTVSYFGTPNEPGRRGLAKACFNFLGIKHPDLARQSCFDALRANIMAGDHSSSVGTYLDMGAPVPVQLGTPVHALLVSSTISPPLLVGQAVLFGEIKFTIIMVEEYAGPPLNALLLQDPWRRVATELGLVCESRDVRHLPSMDPSENLPALHQTHNLHREINRVHAWTEKFSCFVQSGQDAGLQPGDALTRKAAFATASALAKARMGLPIRREVSSIEEAARRKEEEERLLREAARKAPWILN